MPETRYQIKYTYPADMPPEQRIPENATIEQIPYEVTDGQLYQEQLGAEFNDAHNAAINALKNWGSLTLAQKDALLRGLVKWALWKDDWLKLGVL